MQNKKYVLCTLLLHSQSLTFQSISDNLYYTAGFDGIQLNNNNLILGGNSQDYNLKKSCEIFLFQADSMLNLKWMKKYNVDTTAAITLYYIKQISNKDILIGGRLLNKITNKAILIKTDSLGYLKWAKRYNSSDPLYFMRAVTGGCVYNGRFVKM